jgi:hypothetical protein
MSSEDEAENKVSRVAMRDPALDASARDGQQLRKNEAHAV